VVGILIALQVNNWNENRKQTIELKVVLENLKNEFETNISSIDKNVAKISGNYESNLLLLTLFGNGSAIADSINLDSMLEIAVFKEIWEPSLNVMSELTSSGKLSLIKNEKLKRLIDEWNRLLDECELWNGRVENSSDDIIDYLKDNGALRNINHYRLSIPKTTLNVDHSKLLEDLKFESRVDEKSLYAQFQINAYREIKKNMKMIIEEIQHD
jgi:hypothetical protein